MLILNSMFGYFSDVFNWQFDVWTLYPFFSCFILTTLFCCIKVWFKCKFESRMRIISMVISMFFALLFWPHHANKSKKFDFNTRIVEWDGVIIYKALAFIAISGYIGIDEKESARTYKNWLFFVSGFFWNYLIDLNFGGRLIQLKWPTRHTNVPYLLN
jgi:hypothetical protein